MRIISLGDRIQLTDVVNGLAEKTEGVVRFIGKADVGVEFFLPDGGTEVTYLDLQTLANNCVRLAEGPVVAHGFLGM